ncbi:MAG: hypothetical protein Q7J27_04400 [Syntrophales bacterium]|nr:hypothetical protein [Syntrophales bacterium]
MFLLEENKLTRAFSINEFFFLATVECYLGHPSNPIRFSSRVGRFFSYSILSFGGLSSAENCKREYRSTENLTKRKTPAEKIVKENTAAQKISQKEKLARDVFKSTHISVPETGTD